MARRSCAALASPRSRRSFATKPAASTRFSIPGPSSCRLTALTPPAPVGLFRRFRKPVEPRSSGLPRHGGFVSSISQTRRASVLRPSPTWWVCFVDFANPSSPPSADLRFDSLPCRPCPPWLTHPRNWVRSPLPDDRSQRGNPCATGTYSRFPIGFDRRLFERAPLRRQPSVNRHSNCQRAGMPLRGTLNP